MNKKYSINFTQDEIEYLKDLLMYEIADPEPRLANHLDIDDVDLLRDKFLRRSIDNPKHLEKFFNQGAK